MNGFTYLRFIFHYGHARIFTVLHYKERFFLFVCVMHEAKEKPTAKFLKWIKLTLFYMTDRTSILHLKIT